MIIPTRALPRLFIPGARSDAPFELPSEELHKLRKVLRLSSGDPIAVLPDDGTLIRCTLQGHQAVPTSVEYPATEPSVSIKLLQALPKGDKLEEIVRACTEIGVSDFEFFPSDRTVVRWDIKKTEDRLSRLRAIARESSEGSFRTHIPRITTTRDLADALKQNPTTVVLSELEGLEKRLKPSRSNMSVMVGPEGGWSPRELALIGDRGVSLGPRVLRVEHAGAAAAAILLLSD